MGSQIQGPRPCDTAQALEDMLVHGTAGRPPAIPEDNSVVHSAVAAQGDDSILESGALEVCCMMNFEALVLLKICGYV